jgi:2-polyprenyl-3-methyl-5-hydroxy-6-metoxy-1,4-benzoquinol methylase
MNSRDHWQRVYQAKPATEVSWYTAHLRQSLEMIREVTSPDARVIDVGGGASTLVDDLLGLGYRDLTVLDVSEAGLAMAQWRLGPRAAQVRWIAADVITVQLAQNSFDLWHDRAVFHFLKHEADRKAYLHQLQCSVVMGGHVVIATFSLQGPTMCSGLEVMRYDAQSLARELGSQFALNAQLEATHTTPAGKAQRFVFCRFQKLA